MKDKEMKLTKKPDEILKQYYLTAEDLTIIMPSLKMGKARKYINEIQEEMQKLNYFVPKTKTKMALTKLVKKKFGL